MSLGFLTMPMLIDERRFAMRKLSLRDRSPFRTLHTPTTAGTRFQPKSIKSPEAETLPLRTLPSALPRSCHSLRRPPELAGQRAGKR